MRLTELAIQNVAGLLPAARLPLAPGLNALVARNPDPFLLFSALFDASVDTGTLRGAGAPRRLAATIQGDDGVTYRLLRDLDGSQTLLKNDPATKQIVRLSEDPAEIAGLLRSLGLPTPGQLRGHYWIQASTLGSAPTPQPPSIQSASIQPSATTGAPTGPRGMTVSRRLPDLEVELARAEQLERAQDEIHELRQQYDGFGQEVANLTQLERRSEALTREIDALSAQTQSLTGFEDRIRKLPELKARHDSAMNALVAKREEYESQIPEGSSAGRLKKDPLILAGAGVGILCIILAVALGMSWVLLLDAIPFAIAAFGLWRWVDSVQTADNARRRLADLKEHEKRARTQYEAETAPVRAALGASGLKDSTEVLARLEQQDELKAERQAIADEMTRKRADPAFVAAEQERHRLEAEIQRCEQLINDIGFSRASSEIKYDIQQVEAGGTATAEPRSDALAEAMFAAADAAGATPGSLLEGFGDRLGQYLVALTDRRYKGVKGVAGGWELVTAQGASATVDALPGNDRLLVCLAVRLALLERVAAVVKRPAIVDEPSLFVDAGRRALLLKMLKGIGTLTQVIVRTFEPPPAGSVDQICTAGAPSP